MKSLTYGAKLIGGVALIFSLAVRSEAAQDCLLTPGDVSPDGIKEFLIAKNIKTAAGFVECLPEEYKKNWIMMSLSASSQSGTARFPRFILTSNDSSNVFGFEVPSNPDAHAPNTVEYIQFDPTINAFRFHSVVTDQQEVRLNETSCRVCHKGFPKGNPRANWDAYDSWGGLLPFNRDRIYQKAVVNGMQEESVEAKAIKRIFKALKKDPKEELFPKLTLPDGITQDPTTGEVTIAFDGQCAPTLCFDDPGDGGMRSVDYDKDTDGHVVYPGKAETIVKQGGRFLRLNFPGKLANTDDINDFQGRGVALFDNFTSLNSQRVAQMLLDYVYVKDNSGNLVRDNTVVDVRYVALAITYQALQKPGFEKCITADTLGKFAPKEDLVQLLAFQTRRNPKVTNFQRLVDETDTLRKSLPALKANLQSLNLEELIKANGDEFTPERLNANIARRSTQGLPPDFNLGWMIDREQYAYNTTIALFRLFLEPLPPNNDGIRLPVNEWTMSVFGHPVFEREVNHSITYTFADAFGQYVTQLKDRLEGSLGQNLTCSNLAAGSIKAFNAATNKTPPE